MSLVKASINTSSISNNSNNNINFSGVSCDICRRRKVKCSRDLPSCSWCVKNKATCSYPSHSHRRRNDKSSQTGKISINLDNGKNKYFLFNSGKVVETGGEVKLIVKAKAKGGRVGESNEGLNKFCLYQTLKTDSNLDTIGSSSSDSSSGSSSPALGSIRLQSDYQQEQRYQFKLQTLVLLIRQILDNQPELTEKLNPFYECLKTGEFGSSGIKLKIFMSSNWYQVLHNPGFDTQLIDNFFNIFNPFINYLSKFHFYRNLQNMPPVLMSVIRYIGYQFTLNQDKSLRNFLKDLCLMELKKCMFKVNLVNCTSLLIFSYAELMQGFIKKSWAYYNQGCLMANALGIHLDVPSLNELEQERRRIIKSMVICHDLHFFGVLDNAQPYFHYMVYQVNCLNYKFQLPPTPHLSILEIVNAQAGVTLRYVYDRYWLPAIYHISTFSSKNSKNHLTFDELDKTIQKFTRMLDYCYIKSLEKFVQLGAVHNFKEAHKIIETNVIVFVLMYHHLILGLFSHYPTPTTIKSKGEKSPLWLTRALYGAKIIFNIARKCPKSYLIMHHHYLTEISLFYLKFGNLIDQELASEFKSILQSIYEMFLNYNEKFLFSNLSTEAFIIISKALGYNYKNGIVNR
ncbi:hypothetical protein CONCODRAFT_169785 [Conidiobolus coronatus NRRL 28638]|uniref:Zn(2)-C6 fungal-type domain-containing protein n=1 Tax=Conidiobolus coronatus (strain ATCC 28846 / CBS 209.66 / NRRL 28638) TaxID=796925 RepID=A0A137NQX5_CONC2|nr:hypothetical protein CONCODRAFT_169785 [Conidiobolus coronatus NRRL 28638]|eukprot:KXN65124.1 hypothetical protein CONCODRAFT_169785 [Conidiobolus coronatus NRRL 28638]